MKCQNCSTEMVESNLNHNSEDMVITRYFCFECNTLYELSSQGGDLVEEYLEEISMD